MKGIIVAVIGFFLLAWAKETPVIIAYYNPDCRCCTKYFDLLEDKGYKIKRVEVDSLTLYKKKNEMGVPVDKRSCHTMKVGDKFIEGHVPVEGIEALLNSKNAKGVYSPHGTSSGFGVEEDIYIIIR